MNTWCNLFMRRNFNTDRLRGSTSQLSEVPFVVYAAACSWENASRHVVTIAFDLCISFGSCASSHAHRRVCYVLAARQHWVASVVRSRSCASASKRRYTQILRLPIMGCIAFVIKFRSLHRRSQTVRAMVPHRSRDHPSELIELRQLFVGLLAN